VESGAKPWLTFHPNFPLLVGDNFFHQGQPHSQPAKAQRARILRRLAVYIEQIGHLFGIQAYAVVANRYLNRGIRAFAQFVKGKKKADNVTAWIVPGSRAVEKQIIAEGLVGILNEAGFELRQPGCSACLAMNDDKIPEGKYSVSTSNRNFEGRQGPGARTLLASPLTAAAAAVTGRITDPREFLD